MAHSWPAQSPEANHTVLASGPGSVSTLAHAEELSAQAAQLQALASASQTNAAGTYGSSWSGAGAAGSQTAHAGVNTQLAALAGWLQARAPIVTAAAQAYHTAVSTMVPTHEAQANRVQEASAVEINPRVLGALTPQITELNLDYFGHMWPTNASAGASYGAALNTAMVALATPPPPATPAASPEAPATAAQAIADAEDRTATGEAMRQAHGSAQAVSAVIQHSSTMSQAMVPPPTPPAATAPSTKFAELRPPVAPAPSTPPPVGMYQQPPSNAAVYGPPAPAAAPGAAAGLRPGVVGVPAAGPPPAGVTRFIRPVDPFAVPSLPGAPAAAPGILNAATVYAAAAATPTNTVPLQPLEQSAAAQAPPPTPVHSLNPPPASPTTPTPAGPPTPSAPPESPPPRPDQGSVQMLGHGSPPPQAPPAPPPPPPPPGEPPLRPAPIPPWAVPAPSESEVHAHEQYQDVIKKIQAHNSHWPNQANRAEVALYNSEANYLNTWKAQLEGQLDGWNADYTRETITARNHDITSGWTQPAPENSTPPQAPHAEIPNSGPGSWGPVNESMSERAAEYQQYITGHPISEGYRLPGFKVTFDGYDADGAVLEVKSYYSQFIENGAWKPFFQNSGAVSNMIVQAERQLEAALANGVRLRWVFLESSVRDLVEQTLNKVPGLEGMIECVVIPY